MKLNEHVSQKCARCFTCFREGEESRRLGGMTISIWTRVGLYSLNLCGRCAAPVREVLSKDRAYVDVENAIAETPAPADEPQRKRRKK